MRVCSVIGCRRFTVLAPVYFASPARFLRLGFSWLTGPTSFTPTAISLAIGHMHPFSSLSEMPLVSVSLAKMAFMPSTGLPLARSASSALSRALAAIKPS